MKLYLVQHAEAKPKSEDPERPLSDAGVEHVQRMAAWAARLPVEVAEIRHSGKLRAAQTAEGLGARLHPVEGVTAVDYLDPMAEVPSLGAAIAEEDRDLMLVGHLPHLERLAAWLLAGRDDAKVVEFRNAGLVCLEREGEGWHLSWAVPPDLVSM